MNGLELSPHMAAQLQAKPGADAVPVTIGDTTAARVRRAPFTLVYLAANTIMNVTTQDDQLAVFANAAAHLGPGGCFVVEVIVPQLRRFPPGETARVFTLDPDHVGIETFDDVARQIAWSRITGSKPTAPWCAIRRPTGTSGRLSSTSWPRSPVPAPGPLGRLGPGAVHLR